MHALVFQSILSFFLSAAVVIIITIIAERYGTKIGGIIGTLPSTLIIALLFIAINKGEAFAAQTAAVVPAEMGINLIFLFIFVLLIPRSLPLAILGSFTTWTILSLLLYYSAITSLFHTLLIFITALLATFLSLEYLKNIPSTTGVRVHYTPKKILLRGILAGVVIAIAISLSHYGPLLSGIFSVFPAIFFSTMLISVREHGASFAAPLGKIMILGSITVTIYAALISLLYPTAGILTGTILAFLLSLGSALTLFYLRKKIK